MKELNYIKFEDLEDRGVYTVDARNFNISVWSSEENGFIGIAYSLGIPSLEIERHWDTDPHFGTVKPIRKIGTLPENIECTILNNKKLFGYLTNLGK
jgi:hypothetical protein